MSADKKKGLRERPTYNELIEEIQLDEKIKLPNRKAMFLRNSPYLSFLDGETLTEMNTQQQQVDKQIQVEHTIRQEASDNTTSASVLRAMEEAQRTQNNIDEFLDARSEPGDMSQSRNMGAVGSGGYWDPNTGWNAGPDPLLAWYDAPNTAPPHVPPQDSGFSSRITQELTRHEGRGLAQISSIISNHMGNEPHGNLMNALVSMDVDKTKTPRKETFEDKGAKKSKKGKSLEEEYEDLMKDVAPHLPKSKPAPAPAPKATSKPAPPPPQPSQPAGAKKTPPPQQPKKPAATGVKPNPAFQKNPQAATTFRTHDHGTEMDTSKDKKHWQSKGIGYLKDQLEKRGKKINPARLRGKNALNKGDLLKMLYKHDGI